MRPLVHGDVTTAARVLLAAPSACRRALAVRMLREAERADAYRFRTGRTHPFWGNGTLMAAALAHGPAPEPPLDDRGYLSCLAVVIDALLAEQVHPEPDAVSQADRADAA